MRTKNLDLPLTKTMTDKEKTRVINDIEKALNNISYAQHILKNSLDGNKDVSDRLWKMTEELKEIRKIIRGR